MPGEIADLGVTAKAEFGSGDPILKTKKISVTATPVLKLVEIPLFEERGTILDNPPLYPDINFVPYKGIDDSISIFINSNLGSETEVPIIFNEEESEFYTLFRETKKYNEFEPILYKTDESENLGSAFEVYRVDTTPLAYSNFFGNLRTTVSTVFSNDRDIPAASYMDKLQPNKKYYYTFRMLDQRGVPSNPSPVYELEMVSADGIIFPIIKPFEFGDTKKSRQISFKKLLNIVPSLGQVTPKFDPTRETYSGFDDSAVVGVEDESLYGKSFKLRMTSKDTGKVIDLNLTFSVEIEETES